MDLDLAVASSATLAPPRAPRTEPAPLVVRHERIPPPRRLRVHCALVVTLVVGDATYHHSKARFLLGAFPLLLLPARALAALRAGTLVVLLTGLVVVSAWYNAYVLVLWRLSP